MTACLQSSLPAGCVSIFLTNIFRSVKKLTMQHSTTAPHHNRFTAPGPCNSVFMKLLHNCALFSKSVCKYMKLLLSEQAPLSQKNHAMHSYQQLQNSMRCLTDLDHSRSSKMARFTMCHIYYFVLRRFQDITTFTAYFDCQ